MKRDSTHLSVIVFSLKRYERNSVITFPSNVVSLHLHQLSLTKHIKLISKASIIQPDKPFHFSFKSHKHTIRV